MDKKIFDFEEYKAFLLFVEQSRAHFSKGFRSKLALAIGCNNGFVSQVLNSGAHFSLEQAIPISRYLNLVSDEEHFFLLMIEYARAGTKEVKQYFRCQMGNMREKFLNIKDRVRHQTILAPEVQSTYYSQWYFAAVHMAVTIPSLRTTSNIAVSLNLSKKTVDEVVTFLLANDLVIKKGGHLLPGPTYLHLDDKSPNISRHHTNWRITAINSLQNKDDKNIHYSTVSTLSLRDVEILKSQLVQHVQDYVRTVSESKKEDVLYGFNLDFFKLNR